MFKERFLVKGLPIFVSKGLVTITVQKELSKAEFHWFTRYLITEGFMSPKTRVMVRALSRKLFQQFVAEASQ